MYTTSQIVQRIKLQAPEWSSLGDRGLIAIINEVDHVMMEADIDHNVVIDSSTGLPPYLATTAGIRNYECPSDCRKVADLYFEDTSINAERSSRYGERDTAMFLDREFFSEPITARRRMVSSAGVVQPATVTFVDDPGTTAKIYHLKYWRQSTDIVSVNIQPNVAPEFHWLLIDGVLARVQPIQYGAENPWLAWMERMKELYWGEMNDNPPKRSQVATRPC